MIEIPRRRFGALAMVAVLVFASLYGKLWFLQIMSSADFEQSATSNRERDIIVEAPRGRILDAKGRVLAGRRESLVVTLDWTTLRDIDAEERGEVFAAVAGELNEAGLKTKTSDLATTYTRARDGSLKPVIVAEDVGEQVWILIQERAYPGFQVERRWVRTYPYGDIGAHIVGYTGSVRSREQADTLNADNEDKTYLPGDALGIAGIEKIFEQTLRGVPEVRRVEIDANNRVIRTAEVLQASVPGNDIHLTVDIDLQYAAEQILADELRLARRREAGEGNLPHVGEAGSLVALDVTDGSVVALASFPTYDPSDFIFGISTEQFEFLENRQDKPLFDRATRGLYPAGSTFKVATAYAALESGLRTEWEIWEDEGVYDIDECTAGCRFRNAGSAVMGPVDLREALERSSDTYFYAVGAEAWENQTQVGQTPIQDAAALLGLGAPTGIALPNEAEGRVPTPENRLEEFGTDWFAGDNVIMAIGQGEVAVTPLQLANAYATLATGGTRYQPRLVERASDAETGETTLEVRVIESAGEPLDPAFLAAIRDGLFRVPASGTAAEAFAGFPLDQYPIAGKTGTAEVTGKADFALFAGFGPGLNPKYAVSAVLEESGFGGDAAAPAVRRFFELLAGIEPTPPAPLATEDRFQFDRPLIPENLNVLDEPDQADNPEQTTDAAGSPASTTTAIPASSVADSTAPPLSEGNTTESTDPGEATTSTAADPATTPSSGDPPPTNEATTTSANPATAPETSERNEEANEADSATAGSTAEGG